MHIVQNVRARRKELHLTQEKLSERADVSLGSIKRFERTGEISLTSLVKIAYVPGCEDDFDELFKKKKYQSIQENKARSIAEETQTIVDEKLSKYMTKRRI